MLKSESRGMEEEVRTSNISRGMEEEVRKCSKCAWRVAHTKKPKTKDRHRAFRRGLPPSYYRSSDRLNF